MGLEQLTLYLKNTSIVFTTNIKGVIITGIYIYTAIIIASLIIEAMTTSLVAIWFIPSAIVGIVLDLLGVNIVIQIIVFFVISTLLMLLFYKKLRDVIASKQEKTGIDALVGSKAVAEDDIDPMKPGRVKAGNMSWSAIVDDDSEEIKKGDIVTVMSIEGVKLRCKKAEQNEAKTIVFDSDK